MSVLEVSDNTKSGSGTPRWHCISIISFHCSPHVSNAKNIV
jgi:hypothetical protein